jgi:signal transduction histidine kinase
MQGHKRKTGIKRKIILMICSAVCIIAAAAISIGYFLGNNLLRGVILEEHREIAHRISGTVSEMINEETDDIQAYADEHLWKALILERNLMYKTMAVEDIRKYFADKDKSWIEAPDDSPLIKECLESKSSVKLKAIRMREENVAEIFITDIAGGLVAASNRTSDFYQADEEWWQKAYNQGKGSVFLGDVEFDESNGAWTVPVAVPVRDEAGGIIGVCKASLRVDNFFAPLARVKIQETGHALLVNEDSDIIFHSGVTPLSRKLCGEGEFQKLINDKNHWGMISESEMHATRFFVAFSDIDNPLLSANKIKWMVLVSQDAAEVFKPLNELIAQMWILIGVIIVLIIPIGYLFGNVFVKPIHELHVATEEIIKGNWDYKIDIRTGDEIEQFANTFKGMISVIKNRQQELLRAKTALENLASDLEKRVEERTRDLTRAQEATLNILEDLAESKSKLEEALKIKSEFTSVVSHELRTPLTAIKEGIGIVSDGTAGTLTKEQKGFLDIAKRNVDRLARLINDILDFQKLEAGVIAFDIRENSINDAVREAQKTMSALAGEKKLKFTVDLDERLPKFKFDRDKIIQVLYNLLNNAIKFTEAGAIAVKTRHEGNMAHVSVEDTGRGIKEEDLPRLFQKFSQLENGLERKTGGSGLGLAISKEIIERHKGKIWAESKPGTGSVFNFILPIAERRG